MSTSTAFHKTHVLVTLVGKLGIETSLIVMPKFVLVQTAKALVSIALIKTLALIKSLTAETVFKEGKIKSFEKAMLMI